jgi:hypothetical protein
VSGLGGPHDRVGGAGQQRAPQRVGVGAVRGRRPVGGRIRQRPVVDVGVLGVVSAVGRGFGIEDQFGHPDRPGPIDQRMVDLVGERPPAARQSLEDDQLPEWAITLQLPGRELCDPAVQLSLPAGRRQPVVAHVV